MTTIRRLPQFAVSLNRMRQQPLRSTEESDGMGQLRMQVEGPLHPLTRNECKIRLALAMIKNPPNNQPQRVKPQ